jgi:hypothetical protein
MYNGRNDNLDASLSSLGNVLNEQMVGINQAKKTMQ